MNKWRKNFAAVMGNDRIVRIELSPDIGDQIEGYVVGVSELFVMLHALDSNYINLNGYSVVRRSDIRRYRIRDDFEFFLNRALKLKGNLPAPQPNIDLSSFATLLETANASFPLITLHLEIMYSDLCFIGRVQKLTAKTVVLKEINPAAKWERTRRYNYKDITRVDFGGGYEEALALVAEHEV
ncbi:MAG TPA: hypothetical protein VF585_08090 [Chthoniobacterales bacterium]|jgi:hypothetical protein